MRETIRLSVIVGMSNFELDMMAHGNFLINIRDAVGEKIESLPEFREKGKDLEVQIRLFKVKARSDQKEEKIICKEIEVDVSDIVCDETDLAQIMKIVVDSAVNAVQKELPNIEASPALTFKVEAKKKKCWWKFWENEGGT